MQSNTSDQEIGNKPTKEHINSKGKGKRVELLIAHWLKDRKCPSARRSQQYSGTDGTSDITAAELPHIHIECKGTTSPSIPRSKLLGTKGWLPQVQRDCPKGKFWVIIHKANVHEMVALVSPMHFRAIAVGNVSPIAVTGENFSPVMELEKAYQVLRTIQAFNGTMGYSFEETVPIVVYEVDEGKVLIGLSAEIWIKWVLEWEKQKCASTKNQTTY